MPRDPQEMLPVAAATRAKFFADGRARPYPGNTIVTHLAPHGADFAALVELSRELRTAPGTRAHTFLPCDSFHMTLFRGVNDRLRDPREWPEDIDLDTPLDSVTDIFLQRLAGVRLPERFPMRPCALTLNASGEIQLILRGKDAATERALATARHTLHHRLRHRRSGDDAYRFHITLAYRTRALSVASHAELERHLVERYRRFASSCTTLTLHTPTLCRYRDMLAFAGVAPLTGA
ncbi:DUF1868 domain-containing protein [Halomonas sp. MCCC 1A11036]|uniref:DUF1868 domain-containing protein n=1 Tax=Billgrantia zhangzhouensis TaxID=2733481 RepID=A0ABS9AF15_9GAMM|nr:DUF1868 domain-containing protein [Halomonas zhangzhouensis]MCE8020340.1 DUF1868 domain-containing protein [Halomonas zhangzhouensis]